MSRFSSWGGEHAGDDLLIFPGKRAGDRRHVEPPGSDDQGHDLYGPGLGWEGRQRLHPEAAAGGTAYCGPKAAKVICQRFGIGFNCSSYSI